jgi:hypothetical protein
VQTRAARARVDAPRASCARHLDGKDIAPTGKRFEVDFRADARWGDDGRIIEENLFYDLVSFMHQVRLGGSHRELQRADPSQRGRRRTQRRMNVSGACVAEGLRRCAPTSAPAAATAR